ncbi:MAG: hypothetical protein JXQ30_09215 [Spirochaetes bacterium]|nr:hypothetical protein [Spirochaetota bacterium]
MDTTKQMQFLVGSIREAKKKIVLGAIAASVLSVLLFVVGSYYLLFRVFESMTRDYYASLLRGISSFQTDLIGKENTSGDLKRIASELSSYRGVNEVWFADRFGRLIFATDRELFSQFENRRLPSEYFESVQHVWRFENGRPVPKIVPVTKLLGQRFSIPIYPFRTEGYDFVMGIDVNRFVYLPDNYLFILLSAGYFVVFSALLFFPLFFWVSNRLASIAMRIPMIVGSQAPGIRAAEQKQERPYGVREEEPAPAGSEEEAEKAGSNETESAGGVAGNEPAPGTGSNKRRRPERVSPEKERGKEEKKTPLDGTSKEGSSKEGASAEVEAEAGETAFDTAAGTQDLGEATASAVALASFVERKKALFMHEDIQLPFINASCYVHNSSGVDGSYLYKHKTGEKVYFISFLLPYGSAEDALAGLNGLLNIFNEGVEKAGHVRDFSKGLNEFCLENGMKLNLSVLAVETGEKSVRYSAFGSGRAFYLKSGKDEPKELVLDLPELGEVDEDAFSEHPTFADIRFQQNDLFFMLPQDIFQPGGGGEAGPDGPGARLSGTMREMGEKSAFECSMSIGRTLHEISGSRQTGLVTVKFL